MENIVSASHNKGALPRDYEELQIMAGEPEEIETVSADQAAARAKTV